MICYVDFHSCLKANYPKSLPFTLKGTFALEIHCKKHLPTPKTAVKKPSQYKYDQSKTLFGVAWKHQILCDVTHQMTSGWTPSRYLQVYKYRWAGRLCRSLTPPRTVHALRKWRHYKPLKARCLRRLILLETSRFWGRNVQKSLGEISGKLMSHIERTDSH